MDGVSGFGGWMGFCCLNLLYFVIEKTFGYIRTVG